MYGSRPPAGHRWWCGSTIRRSGSTISSTTSACHSAEPGRGDGIGASFPAGRRVRKRDPTRSPRSAWSDRRPRARAAPGRSSRDSGTAKCASSAARSAQRSKKNSRLGSSASRNTSWLMHPGSVRERRTWTSAASSSASTVASVPRDAAGHDDLAAHGPHPRTRAAAPPVGDVRYPLASRPPRRESATTRTRRPEEPPDVRRRCPAGVPPTARVRLLRDAERARRGQRTAARRRAVRRRSPPRARASPPRSASRDMTVTRDELVAHVTLVAGAVDDPGERRRRAVLRRRPGRRRRDRRAARRAGAAGLLDRGLGSRRRSHRSGGRRGGAGRRGRASAAHAHGMVLTARCEHHIRGVDDLDGTVHRLAAYREAGADAVFAPGRARPRRGGPPGRGSARRSTCW